MGKPRPIYLVRHGHAEDDHRLGDEARALTAEGRRDFRAFAHDVRKQLEIVGVVTSPLVRAVQTAELLAEAVGIDDIVVRGELSVEAASPARIVALARELGPGWALVGHNPSMGLTLAELLERGSDGARFRKGAIAAVGMVTAGPWTLDWIASPGHKPKSSF